MRASPVLLLVLASTVAPVPAAEEGEGAKYRQWCTRRADTERLAAGEREASIQECMTSLAEADRNPDRAASERDGSRGAD